MPVRKLIFPIALLVVAVLLILFGDSDWFGNRHPLELDLAALPGGLTEQQLQEEFAETDFSCDRDTSGLGERVCAAGIESVNGIPARYIAFYFGAGEQLRGVKIAAYESQQQVLRESFREAFGEPRQPNPAFLSWTTPGGELALANEAQDGEVTVLWVTGTGPAAE